ncbi:hypothetical protein KEM52_000015 [Ascosphaera acerosa]|nr:hypothetical protein KEM52_000015 [Ascosphaera acerosa]
MHQSVMPRAYTIGAANITAVFTSYGARLMSLTVPDRHGQETDIALGYDDPHDYIHDTETVHTNFGAVVGRYANRIANGTFTLNGRTYNIPKNELNGTQTLHGGIVGYDQRNWTVTSWTNNSITFSLFDDGFENFPGQVLTHAIYSVKSTYDNAASEPVAQLTTKLVSMALTEETPIMLSNHIYWNLGAFQTATVLDDATLHLPLSERFIEIDTNEIPTGEIGDVRTFRNGTFDFTQPKLIGQDIAQTYDQCGAGCTGIDQAFIVDRPPAIANPTSSPDNMARVLSMASRATGITMDMETNQRAIQIFTCDTEDGTIPVKRSQLARNRQQGRVAAEFVEKYGCIVIEAEQWIDAINNPQWGELPYQLFSPSTGPAVNWVTYTFGTRP